MDINGLSIKELQQLQLHYLSKFRDDPDANWGAIKRISFSLQRLMEARALKEFQAYRGRFPEKPWRWDHPDWLVQRAEVVLGSFQPRVKRKKLLRWWDHMTDASWDSVHGLILRKDRVLTLWDAWKATDASAPRVYPAHNVRLRLRKWDRLPTGADLERAIRYAVGDEMEMVGEYVARYYEVYGRHYWQNVGGGAK